MCCQEIPVTLGVSHWPRPPFSPPNVIIMMSMRKMMIEFMMILTLDLIIIIGKMIKVSSVTLCKWWKRRWGEWRERRQGSQWGWCFFLGQWIMKDPDAHRTISRRSYLHLMISVRWYMVKWYLWDLKWWNDTYEMIKGEMIPVRWFMVKWYLSQMELRQGYVKEQDDVPTANQVYFRWFDQGRDHRKVHEGRGLEIGPYPHIIITSYLIIFSILKIGFCLETI